MANELILIIEDNEVNRVLVRDMLRFKGYRTVETQTAEDGLRVAREQKPALILMDFHLPKMNGIEAFQELRADAATSAIPVIAVTASAMPEDRKKILDAGFDGLQTKPIHVAEFFGTVERALISARGWIAGLHRDDRSNDFRGWSFRAGRTSTSRGRKQ